MCLLFIAVGGALLYITAQTSEMYSLEITQRINRDIALHAAEDMPLLDAGGVNKVALKELAHHVMFINPIVEVYLLDIDGRVLSHALPYDTVLLDRVDMAPLERFMAGEQALPIFGDDPRSPDERKVFSVSPILEDGEPVAYLYTVLNGKTYEGMQQSLEESYNLRAGSLTIVSSLLVALLAGAGLFFLMTRRLKSLAEAVRAYREGSYQGRITLQPRRHARDEIDELTEAIADMSERIEQQFSAQHEIDRTRRELIANVSHDLRTPIASMQGYLETVLVKDLDENARHDYLETAHKHCARLNELIGELFELSRLESSTVEPEWEAFPVMELVQDIIHDHELLAREREITLSAHCAQMDAVVYADIAMIHRVLENLIQNALRHTPRGGEIAINVRSDADKVWVEVTDDGEGIASHDIPHIFDRFYRPDTEAPESGHGLGLAIVKRIVELHRSQVAVKSELHQGTAFSFWLPQPA
jgi:signal transduction histidine kinase